MDKTPESSLDCKEIQPLHPKGDQSQVFIGRTDAEAETPVLWPPHAKSWLIGKDPDAVRDWGQEEEGTPEDEMAGWHHWPNGHEFEWTPGVGNGQGGLACCDSWGHKELDTTEWLNWRADLMYTTSEQIIWEFFHVSTHFALLLQEWKYNMESKNVYILDKIHMEKTSSSSRVTFSWYVTFFNICCRCFNVMCYHRRED